LYPTKGTDAHSGLHCSTISKTFNFLWVIWEPISVI
jgi:hypothetical protein